MFTDARLFCPYRESLSHVWQRGHYQAIRVPGESSTGGSHASGDPFPNELQHGRVEKDQEVQNLVENGDVFKLYQTGNGAVPAMERSRRQQASVSSPHEQIMYGIDRTEK